MATDGMDQNRISNGSHWEDDYQILIHRIAFPIGYSDIHWRLAGLITSIHCTHLTSYERSAIIYSSLEVCGYVNPKTMTSIGHNSMQQIIDRDSFIFDMTQLSRNLPGSITLTDYRYLVKLIMASVTLNKETLQIYLNNCNERNRNGNSGVIIYQVLQAKIKIPPAGINGGLSNEYKTVVQYWLRHCKSQSVTDIRTIQEQIILVSELLM